MEGPKNIAAGAIGSRIAGRLTADLVLRSPQYMNCVGEYQIDLRAHKLGAIENLGATQNQFDSMDLSDNAILFLEGFPQLPRLKSLYLSNNKISRVGRNLEESVPNIDTLVLTNNHIKNLQDLNPLASLPRLQQLSLLGNEVAMKQDYRLYVIHRLKQLKHLDFRKVKAKERQAADAKFGSSASPSLPNGQAATTKTFIPGEGLPGTAPSKMDTEEPGQTLAENRLTPQQLTAVHAAIQNAQTMEEVAGLEKFLREGNMPSQLLESSGNGNVPEAMEED